MSEYEAPMLTEVGSVADFTLKKDDNPGIGGGVGGGRCKTFSGTDGFGHAQTGAICVS